VTRRKLLIIGDSSFAEVACELFDAYGTYEVAAFAVHASFLRQERLLGRPVHAFEEIDKLCPPAEFDAFVALAYRELNRARTRFYLELKRRGYALATYISPAARVWRNVTVGDNSFVFENNVIQPFCTIGDNVIIWSGNHVGHHSTLEDNVFVSSHVVISGHVVVGKNSFIGVNATVADSVHIAENNWIGPGALITKDTLPGSMYRVDSTPRSKVSSLRFFRVTAD
jgi:sugar O-acyltransferase (sialic acid O-acetyltransferase NeuD family)